MVNSDLTPFIEVVTDAIQKTSTLSVQIDTILSRLDRQETKMETKLDELLKTVIEVRTKQETQGQSVSIIAERTSDHEARLRMLETKGERVVSEEVFENYKNKMGDWKDKVNAQLVAGATLLIVLQVLVSTFVAPWLQSVLLR